MESKELVDVDNNAITTANDFNIVNVDDAKAFMDNYQDLVVSFDYSLQLIHF